MSGFHPYEGAALNHVLVIAPYRRDADYLQQLLAEHDISVDVCTDLDAIERGLANSPGVLVATQEALTPNVMEAMASHLAAQPAWSEMPVVILLDRSANQVKVRAQLGQAWPRARHIFYQRPVTAVELLSGVQSAVLARMRQSDVRDHIDREIELRHELNHRVKNMLASVASIFEMTLVQAETLDEFAGDYRGRLTALAKVHSAVFHAPDESISIAEIVAMTFQPYQLMGNDRIVTGGPDIIVKRAAATTLALCLHELATNAIKYGSLSWPGGRVSFTWELTGPDHETMAIRWAEHGGPEITEPGGAGYGTRYVRSALSSLFGSRPTISFNAHGLCCEAFGPISRLL